MWQTVECFEKFVRRVPKAIKIFAILNKGKNKTIYVYFTKQKLFGYSPSSVLLNWNEIFLLTLHKNWLLWWFIRKNQYHTNTRSLIDITIQNQFVFYLCNHYWLLSVKTSLEAKDLTKINHKTTEETKDGPNYFDVFLNEISWYLFHIYIDVLLSKMFL